MTNDRNHGGARPNAGGRREGAGRPAYSPLGIAARHTVTLSPEAHAVLAANQYAGESYSRVVDRIVRSWASGHSADG